jgi:hypothetical protein
MKVQSNICAGITFEQCDAQRNYYKGLVQSGKCVANPYPPQPYPPYPPQPYPPYPPQPYPPYPPQPTPPPSGGGYVNGVWYPDRSGTCG